MKTLATALFATSLCLPTALLAHADRDHLDGPFQDRFERQQQRIYHGIENGNLNRKQAKALKKQHRKLRRLNRAFASDGHYDRREKRTMRKKLDKASNRIRRYKQGDRQTSTFWYRDGDADRGQSGMHRHIDNGRQPERYLWSRLFW